MLLNPKGIVTQSQNAAPDPAHSVKCELAGEVLRSSGTLRLQVTGWSMLPTVMPGDTLIIDRVSGDQVGREVSRGEIVLFSRNRRLFAHRVVSMPHGREGRVVTQGDGMPRPDPPMPASDVLGRVRFIVRNGRYIEPDIEMGLSRRAVAELVRQSHSAARVFVSVHEMCRSLKESVVSCQS